MISKDRVMKDTKPKAATKPTKSGYYWIKVARANWDNERKDYDWTRINGYYWIVVDINVWRDSKLPVPREHFSMYKCALEFPLDWGDERNFETEVVVECIGPIPHPKGNQHEASTRY